MKKFDALKSLIMPLPLKDIDTDMLIPAQYLTSISRDGYGENLFRRLRDQDPEFPLNLPKYAGARILVADENFGCGSSREHAVWALQGAGFAVVIAKSFADIFFNNALKNGLVPIALPAGAVDELLKAGKAGAIELEVNLERQAIVGPDFNQAFQFDPFRRHCLLNGIDDLDYLLSHRESIAKFFAAHEPKCFFSTASCRAETVR